MLLEHIKHDLQEDLLELLLPDTPRAPRLVPPALRNMYAERFLEEDPLQAQLWLVFSSQQPASSRVDLAHKLLMRRDIDPLSCLLPAVDEALARRGLHRAGLPTIDAALLGLMDRVVEPAVTMHIQAQRHVRWLVRAVESDEGRVSSRLSRLWSHLDLTHTARALKDVWLPMLQATLRWRSGRRPKAADQPLSDALLRQIDALAQRASFEDFESLVELLAERYRGRGLRPDGGGREPMDDRLRILRRATFWKNYQGQVQRAFFFLSPEDIEIYQARCREGLLLGDDAIICCEGLPAGAPLMLLQIRGLLVASSLTDKERPTRFVPLAPDAHPELLKRPPPRLAYSALATLLEQEPPYLHRYLWQVLFSLILEGAGVAPDDADAPFALGGDKVGQYVRGAGLRFTGAELKKQESQLTELFVERPQLLRFLSDVFGEVLG